MQTPAFEKPLPEPTAETRPHWDGLRQHKLMFQRCSSCHKPRHYPRPMCDQCDSLESEWFDAPLTGKVHSWTVAHHPFHMGFKRELPYTIVTVDMDAGVRMALPVEGDVGKSLAIGTAMRVTFDDVSEELTLPRGLVE